MDIEEIENEEDRQIVEIIVRLDKEYGIGDLLKKALEIEEWCKENYGDKKIWKRRMPTQGKDAKDEYEKKLAINVNYIKNRNKKYDVVDIEKIENEEDRQIVQIMRRLDKEYAYGMNQLHESLGIALEIEEWCKINYGKKKIWERKLPSFTSKDEYEKLLATSLSNLRQKMKEY